MSLLRDEFSSGRIYESKGGMKVKLKFRLTQNITKRLTQVRKKLNHNSSN